MLEVQIILHNARSGDQVVIETAFIWNDGTGDADIGNYHVDIKKPPSQKDVGRGPYAQTWVRGRVVGHRRRESAWELLKRSLNSALDHGGRSQEGLMRDPFTDIESMCVGLVSALDGSADSRDDDWCNEVIAALAKRIDEWRPSIGNGLARILYDEAAKKRAIAAIQLARELMAERRGNLDRHPPEDAVEFDPFADST
jgi:hypothetical protein